MNTPTNLRAALSQFSELSDSDWAHVQRAFTPLQVPKRFLLEKSGKTAESLYFVTKGVLRLYYERDANEITFFIFKEGMFCGSYESFLRQTPGNQFLETLEPAELLTIHHQQLDWLYQTVPAMHIIMRKIAEQRFIVAQRIFAASLLETPEQRYTRFAAEHSDLLQRVPLHIIASFLGITPVSISRIRQRLIHKAQKK